MLCFQKYCCVHEYIVAFSKNIVVFSKRLLCFRREIEFCFALMGHRSQRMQAHVREASLNTKWKRKHLSVAWLNGLPVLWAARDSDPIVPPKIQNCLPKAYLSNSKSIPFSVNLLKDKPLWCLHAWTHHHLYKKGNTNNNLNSIWEFVCSRTLHNNNNPPFPNMVRTWHPIGNWFECCCAYYFAVLNIFCDFPLQNALKMYLFMGKF